MCGIVGYIGKRSAIPIVLEGLRRLEYRGYDSVGIVAHDPICGGLYLTKHPGRIAEFSGMIDTGFPGTVAIGHTRWATHGGVTLANAHPHADCGMNIFVAHNGIIENHRELKKELTKRGHEFRSETDTEVVPHLFEELVHEGLGFQDAVIEGLRKIRGSFALVIFNRNLPNLLIGTRFSSPLALGLGDNEHVFASDATPIALVTKNILYLNDGEVAFVENGVHRIVAYATNHRVERNHETISFAVEESDRGTFPDYMSKEIFEEPAALRNTLRGRLIIEEGKVKLGGVEAIEERMKRINRAVLLACGTASYAAMAGEYFFEEYAEIPTEVDLGSEFRYRKPIIDDRTLAVAVSQSGETADTLAAIREAKEKGAVTLGIINAVGSTIARTVDAGIYSHAGPELAVASTKAFAAQIADLALLMVCIARQRKMSLVMGKRILSELNRIPEKMERILSGTDHIREVAEKYAKYSDFLYLGRKYNYPVALEGALKLKEIAYIHAGGHAAGEMKHGPIALIDENFPSMVIAPKDSVYEKVASNIQEIKARNGKVIAVATEGDEEIARLADDVLYIPKTLEMLTPLLSVVSLHLFAYYIAKKLGRDIDRPRNLAKSVTVE